MARRASLRASDEDRERVADRLRHAAGEGRLLTEELEERIGAVFSSRTYGELDAVVSDLPAPRAARAKTPLWAKATLALAFVTALLAVLAVVAVLVVGLATAWVFWLVFVWLFFGRRARLVGHSRRRVHPLAYGRPGARGPRGGPASL